jgi:hypothetical protein
VSKSVKADLKILLGNQVYKMFIWSAYNLLQISSTNIFPIAFHCAGCIVFEKYKLRSALNSSVGGHQQ